VREKLATQAILRKSKYLRCTALSSDFSNTVVLDSGWRVPSLFDVTVRCHLSVRSSGQLETRQAYISQPWSLYIYIFAWRLLALSFSYIASRTVGLIRPRYLVESKSYGSFWTLILAIISRPRVLFGPMKLMSLRLSICSFQKLAQY